MLIDAVLARPRGADAASARPGSGDRLTVTLFLAALFHLIVILGIALRRLPRTPAPSRHSAFVSNSCPTACATTEPTTSPRKPSKAAAIAPIPDATSLAGWRETVPAHLKAAGAPAPEARRRRR
jgi:hypothetical protein